MKKLFVPILFDETTHRMGGSSCTIYPVMENSKGYYSLEEALESGKHMNLAKPSAKVVIFESVSVIEPRKVDFAVKSFSDQGELLA